MGAFVELSDLPKTPITKTNWNVCRGANIMARDALGESYAVVLGKMLIPVNRVIFGLVAATYENF